MLQAMLREAFMAISTNRMRSFLTMLGMIIGVAAVVLMLAVGEGARITIREHIASLGSNLFIVLAGSHSTGGVRTGSGNLHTLTLDDAKAIKELPGVAGVSPSANNYMQLVAEGQNWNCLVMGVYPDYLAARGWSVAEGRSLDDIDEQSSARVVLVGQTLVREMFQGRDPIGQTLRIRKTPFEVIGVLGAKGQGLDGRDQDDTAIIPYSASRRFLMSSRFRNSVRILFVQAESEEIMPDLMVDIRNRLRESHRLTRPDQEDDFYIENLSAVMESAEAMARTMTILLGAIASISLAVGGIGIMNIMLVSVTERTREIGVRLAIGARRKDILSQFVLEAVLVSVTGGVIGLVLGLGGAFLVEWLWDFKVSATIFSMVMAFTVSASIGLFFGFYPAWKAARQNPIDALRYQ